MRLLALAVAIATLVGCGYYYVPDPHDLSRKVEVCANAGMTAVIVTGGSSDGKSTRVDCRDKL